MSFRDKAVWITGASSGIGAAIAIEFAAQGAKCVLSARRRERLDEVRSRCSDPSKHQVALLDATSFETHESVVEGIERSSGPLDIVVLNAGIGQRGHALESDFEVDRRIMDVNFMGTISLAKLVGRRMAARGSGHIVVISSVLGRIAIPGSSAYSASKFALHGYFEALRGELHPHGVHVTLVCPGYINTEITLHALQEDGSTFGIIDRNHTYGMDADVCARKVLSAVRRKKAVFSVGGKETWAIPLGRFFPGLVRLVGRRYKRS